MLKNKKTNNKTNLNNGLFADNIKMRKSKLRQCGFSFSNDGFNEYCVVIDDFDERAPRRAVMLPLYSDTSLENLSKVIGIDKGVIERLLNSGIAYKGLLFGTISQDSPNPITLRDITTNNRMHF